MVQWQWSLATENIKHIVFKKGQNRKQNKEPMKKQEKRGGG